MLKTPKYAVPMFAFVAVFLVAASTASVAAILMQERPLSGMGTQKGPTIMGLKTTPRRQPTHSIGALKIMNPNIGMLRGPAILKSGMGRLVGGEKQGDKNTPKRAPTLAVTRS